jgi:hypothetical protein
MQGETLVIELVTFIFIPFPASSIRTKKYIGRLLVLCPTDCVLVWSGMTLEYIKNLYMEKGR